MVDRAKRVYTFKNVYKSILQLNSRFSNENRKFQTGPNFKNQ